jgi:hypothetical protein
VETKQNGVTCENIKEKEKNRGKKKDVSLIYERYILKNTDE